MQQNKHSRKGWFFFLVTANHGTLLDTKLKKKIKSPTLSWKFATYRTGGELQANGHSQVETLV